MRNFPKFLTVLALLAAVSFPAAAQQQGLPGPGPNTYFLPLSGGTLTGPLTFGTTNTNDIGTSATVLAPRTVYAGTSFVGPVGAFTTSVSSGGLISTTGAEGSQFQMSLGGQQWNVDMVSAGSFYVHDTTNSKSPFVISPNSTNSITIGTSTVAIVGATTIDTSLTIGAGPAILTSPAAASLQHGAADVDTNAGIAAQVIRSQGALAGGTANQAGKNLTIIVSPGKGTGAGGSLIVQTTPAGSTGTTVGTPTTALTIDSTQLVTVASAFNLTTGGPTSLAHALVNGNNDWRFYVNSGQILQVAGGPSVLVGALTGVRNAGDILTVGISQTGTNADMSATVWNQSNGSSASTSFYLGNSTSNSEFSIVLNSSGNSGGNGANSATITGAAGIFSASTWAFSNASIKLTGVTTGTNADTLCLSATGVVLIQAAACTISSIRFKENIAPLKERSALAMVRRLHPIAFNMIPGDHPNADINFGRRQIGLAAENVAEVDPRMAIYEPDGVTPKSYRQESVIAALVGAVHELKADNDNLRAEVEQMKRTDAR